MAGIFDEGLERNPANFAALSPVSFVERSAEIYGDLPAMIHGARRYDWATLRDRSARLAAALRAMGVERGSTVSTMLANTPEMIEAHYAVPALGAVINALNTRLDAGLLALQMNHCEATVLLTDREFSTVVAEALRILEAEYGRTLKVVDVCDSEYTGPGDRLGADEYEALHAIDARQASVSTQRAIRDALGISDADAVEMRNNFIRRGWLTNGRPPQITDLGEKVMN